jgi:hypothetical protein
LIRKLQISSLPFVCRSLKSDSGSSSSSISAIEKKHEEQKEMQDIPAESVKDADSDKKVPYVGPLLRASSELEPLEDKEQLFVSFQQA